MIQDEPPRHCIYPKPYQNLSASDRARVNLEMERPRVPTILNHRLRRSIGVMSSRTRGRTCNAKPLLQGNPAHTRRCRWKAQSLDFGRTIFNGSAVASPPEHAQHVNTLHLRYLAVRGHLVDRLRRGHAHKILDDCTLLHSTVFTMCWTCVLTTRSGHVYPSTNEQNPEEELRRVLRMLGGRHLALHHTWHIHNPV